MVLNQCMTMVCNFTLLHMDAMLRRCAGISFEDQSLIRIASFNDAELFPTEAINKAENNMLKRASSHSASSASHSAPKKAKKSVDEYLPYENLPRSTLAAGTSQTVTWFFSWRKENLH